MKRLYRTTRRTSETNAMVYRLPVHHSEHRPAWEKAACAMQSCGELRHAMSCARHRFLLVGGALPTPPLQTASAAVPLPLRRPKPMKRVDIADAASTQPIPVPQPDTISDPFSSPTQEPSFREALPSANNATDDRALPFILAKRMPRPFMLFQPGMVAGFAFAILATGLGVFWWFGSLGNTVLANALPVFDKRPNPEVSASPYLVSGAPLKQPGYQAAAVSRTQAGRGKNENDSKEVQSQTRASRSLPIPAHQPAVPVDTQGASGAGAHSATDIASATINSNDQPGKEQRRVSTPATGVAGTADRSSEVSGVKTKASAAMRKNQAKIVKASEKSPSPNFPANRTSPPRTPANASLSAQKASLANDFKQCKSKPSFFQREKCKWQVCAGNWGKDGCPAYNHDIARY